MNPKTFCVNPWVTLHTHITDGFNPCCLFRDTINRKTVNEYVNSPELASIKQRLLNGEQIPECSACWHQESVDYISKRQRDNQTYKNIFQVLNRKPDVPHGKFVEYYLRLGNHCNLRCTSCSDAVSSGWISENKKFNIITKPVKLLPDDHDVWEHLKQNASTIGSIEFIGGEPFMMNIDAQANLLEWLVNNNHARRIRIKYNTNGTRLPTEQLKFWPEFKAVEINVSVDGIGERFEYLRFPGKWNIVESSIDYYKELQKTVPKLELTLISTISVLSIGYINEIVDYCQQRELNLFMNMLQTPAPLNPFNFDKQVKAWIRERIQNINHPVIKNLLDNLNTSGTTVSGKMLLDFLTPLDQRRELDVRKTFPELMQCLDSSV